ncbi:hypothetical protein R3Q06_25555 [Rhodococcus erythropolis]|nr:hypothetical protein [Rhodococcus erythropolis]MDV6276866.1 hypothetical protein [Rhodococcus erythropolis]
MTVLALVAVVLGVTGLLAWAGWRWATGHALIIQRDQLERRNY